MANTYTLAVTSGTTAQVASGATFPALSTSVALAPNQQLYAAGTSTAQVDQVYMAQVTATTGGASIQLASGGLLDPIGGTFSPARVQTVAFYNNGTSNVTIGGTFITGALGSGASIPLHPTGRYVLDNPSATALVVSAGTNSTIVFTAASGTAPVQVLVAGRSV